MLKKNVVTLIILSQLMANWSKLLRREKIGQTVVHCVGDIKYHLVLEHWHACIYGVKL